MQGLLHQAQLAVLQVAQPAVDQPAGGGGGTAAEVALLDEQDGKAAGRRIRGNSQAVDAAADDQEVVRS
jgi:hypothetical protein